MALRQVLPRQRESCVVMAGLASLTEMDAQRGELLSRSVPVRQFLAYLRSYWHSLVIRFPTSFSGSIGPVEEHMPA